MHAPSRPPTLAKIPRIMTNQMLADLDSANPSPSTPSHASHTKAQFSSPTKPCMVHRRCHPFKGCSKADKENIPPTPKNGEATARFLFPERSLPTAGSSLNSESGAIDQQPSHAPTGTASTAQTSREASYVIDKTLAQFRERESEINQDKCELIKYKNPELRTEPPGGYSSANMEQPPLVFHPHLSISNAHQIRNPRIAKDLLPALLSLTCPDGRVTEVFFNPSLDDQFFAKVYFPHATFSGFQDGILHTAEGHVFVCFHFNPDDPRTFELAWLNVPPNVTVIPPGQVSIGPPAQPQPNGAIPAQVQPPHSHHQPPSAFPPLPLRYEHPPLPPCNAPPPGLASAPDAATIPSYHTFYIASSLSSRLTSLNMFYNTSTGPSSLRMDCQSQRIF